MVDPKSDGERQEGAAQPAPAEREEAPPAPGATAGIGGGAPGIASPPNPGGTWPGGGAGAGLGGAEDPSADEAPTGSAEDGGR